MEDTNEYDISLAEVKEIWRAFKNYVEEYVDKGYHCKYIDSLNGNPSWTKYKCGRIIMTDGEYYWVGNKYNKEKGHFLLYAGYHKLWEKRRWVSVERTRFEGIEGGEEVSGVQWTIKVDYGRTLEKTFREYD